MIHFDLPKEKSSIIKVIGVGGGGSNAVNHMFSQNIEGVNFIICNTDAQAIAQSNVPNKIQLGPHLTQGLGAGANPQIGKQACEESLEEIKKILEVNTKMAFITVGMGGGTGTGGGPIISKICRDLGILTVGIVTTPFSYEGKKRQLQAEEGIQAMKKYVDTLLVISNDKLRHQFGNLKMREAFAKADNVLATAAKCITDVINSTGQINVDFADVCTVMKNGGVAILGNAMAEGENRAQKAIEEALNSPLLNDNDISGAKWILININSSEGDHEFTMDEVEIIQNYLLSHAGEGTDVILGLGYDPALGSKIGITLIATGFDYKDPFTKPEPKKEEPKKDEKIVMVLDVKNDVPVAGKQFVLPLPDVVETKKTVVQQPPASQPIPQPQASTLIIKETIEAVNVTLQPTIKEEPAAVTTLAENFVNKNTASRISVEYPAERKEVAEYMELVYSQPSAPMVIVPENIVEQPKQEQSNILPSVSASGIFLNKPANIYASSTPVGNAHLQQVNATKNEQGVNEPISTPLAIKEDASTDMQLVIKENSEVVTPPVSVPFTSPSKSYGMSYGDDLSPIDKAEEQKRRAADRIQKLRNLSFNSNGIDANNEFETVPAYIRRNLELYNTVSPAENFYSSYEVKADNDNSAQITTINTFLDGKKPD